MKTFTVPFAIVANAIVLTAITLGGLIGQLGMCLFSINWVAGGVASMMFNEKLSPRLHDPIRECWQPFIGLLHDWHLSDTAQIIIVYGIAWGITLLASAIIGLLLCLLQDVICRLFYGTPMKIPHKYMVYSGLANTLFALSFSVVGYAYFMASPSVSLFGTSQPEVLWYLPLFFVPLLVWIQHELNKRACGIE